MDSAFPQKGMTAIDPRHICATGLCGLNESRESFWKSAHGEATVPAQFNIKRVPQRNVKLFGSPADSRSEPCAKSARVLTESMSEIEMFGRDLDQNCRGLPVQNSLRRHSRSESHQTRPLPQGHQLRNPLSEQWVHVGCHR